MRTRSILSALFVPGACALAVWLGCGGKAPNPPSNPADNASATPSSGDTSSTASSDTSSTSGSSGSTTPASTDTTPAPAPTPVSPLAGVKFGDTDCGKCIAKTCAKQAGGCSKNAECKAQLDYINACPADQSQFSSCTDGQPQPKTAAGKKAGDGYNKCSGKASKGGACDKQCSALAAQSGK